MGGVLQRRALNTAFNTFEYLQRFRNFLEALSLIFIYASPDLAMQFKNQANQEPRVRTASDRRISL